MQKWFDKVFVINLKIRPDRLSRFLSGMPDELANIRIWPAIHGDTVTHPPFWKSGNGAWGCYRSHVAILEHAISEQYESYLVFEDDAVFAPDFMEQLDEFMNAVPNDWGQVYLGGQLLHEIKNPPKRINQSCYIPYNVNRTHGFAVHKRGYKALYDHLFSLPFSAKDHIDHHLGRLHQSGKFPVYIPRRWMIWQAEGSSNISGRVAEAHMQWPDAEAIARDHWLYQRPLCVFLEAPLAVANELHDNGWHMGQWRDENGLDKGVCEAVSHFYPEIRLREWYEWIRREVVRDDKVIPCLYHPRLTSDLVLNMRVAEWIHIKANSVVEAMDALSINAAYRSCAFANC